jgi:hypothetical protein
MDNILKFKNDPYISVIIPSHSSKFLREAVDSVLNQDDIDKNEFEIIVVKDYEDKYIETYLDNNMVKHFTIEENDVGSKLKVGFEKSNGEILTFLEDDDEYTKKKLSYVREAFLNNSKLTLFRNSAILIDVNGENIKSASDSCKCVQVIRERFEKKFFFMLRNGAASNTSTMAVRKSHLIVFSEFFGSFIGIPDFVIFILSVYKGNCISLCNSPITKIRIHPSWSRIYGNFEDFLARRKEYQMNTLKTIDVLLNVIDDEFIITFLNQVNTMNEIIGRSYSTLFLSHRISEYLESSLLAIKLKGYILLFYFFSSFIIDKISPRFRYLVFMFFAIYRKKFLG